MADKVTFQDAARKAYRKERTSNGRRHLVPPSTRKDVVSLPLPAARRRHYHHRHLSSEACQRSPCWVSGGPCSKTPRSGETSSLSLSSLLPCLENPIALRFIAPDSPDVSTPSVLTNLLTWLPRQPITPEDDFQIGLLSPLAAVPWAIRSQGPP